VRRLLLLLLLLALPATAHADRAFGLFEDLQTRGDAVAVKDALGPVVAPLAECLRGARSQDGYAPADVQLGAEFAGAWRATVGPTPFPSLTTCITAALALLPPLEQPASWTATLPLPNPPPVAERSWTLSEVPVSAGIWGGPARASWTERGLWIAGSEQALRLDQEGTLAGPGAPTALGAGFVGFARGAISDGSEARPAHKAPVTAIAQADGVRVSGDARGGLLASEGARVRARWKGDAPFLAVTVVDKRTAVALSQRSLWFLDPITKEARSQPLDDEAFTGAACPDGSVIASFREGRVLRLGPDGARLAELWIDTSVTLKREQGVGLEAPGINPRVRRDRNPDGSKARLWDLSLGFATKEILQRFGAVEAADGTLSWTGPQPEHYPLRVTSISCAPNSDLILLGAENGRVLLWDRTNRDLVIVLEPSRSPVAALAVSPDGSRIFVADNEGRASIWPVPAR
jgi:hypothetical protein